MEAEYLMNLLGISRSEAESMTGNPNVAAAQVQEALSAKGGSMDDYYDYADVYEAYASGMGQDYYDMGGYQDYSQYDPAATDPYYVYPQTDPAIEQIQTEAETSLDLPVIPLINWDYYMSPAGDLPDPVDPGMTADEILARALEPGGSIETFAGNIDMATTPETPEEANKNIADFFASIFPEPGTEQTPEIQPWTSSMFPTDVAKYNTGINPGGGSIPISSGGGGGGASAAKTPESGQPSTLDTLVKQIGAALTKLTGSTSTQTSVGTVSQAAGTSASQAGLFGGSLPLLIGGGLLTYLLLSRKPFKK